MHIYCKKMIKYLVFALFYLLTNVRHDFKTRSYHSNGVTWVSGAAIWDPELKMYVNYNHQQLLPQQKIQEQALSSPVQGLTKIIPDIDSGKNTGPDVSQPDPTVHPNSTSSCISKNLTFIPQEEAFKRLPPLLLSYPGSGNSWMRKLVESATGYLTGALEINDKEYLHGETFKAEKFCGVRQAAVKGHPQDFFHYYTLDKHEQQTRWMNKEQRVKCKKGSIMQFHRFIFVYRNPADAIWANYQLQKTGSHTGRILKDYFNVSEWSEFAVDTSNVWYQQWVQFLNSTLHDTPPADIFSIKYEELLDATKRIEIMKNLMQFMKYSHVTEKDLQCAFELADRPSIRRPTSFNSSIVSIGHAYYKGLSQSAVCHVIGKLSEYNAYAGYTQFKPTLKFKSDESIVDSSFGKC